MSTVASITWLHDHRHDCAHDDCDVVLTIDASTIAATAVDEMRRNPDAVYCRRQRCGHAGAVHAAGGCLTEGCECAELQS